MVKNVRQSNFEVMRMLSMLFVVMWHLILHSGLYELLGTIKFCLEFLVLLGVVHINSFVLVTGYFQSEGKFSLKKFFKLFFLTWFYKALFVLIFYFLGLRDISKLELFKELMPIDSRDYWYVNCYLGLYLLSPWLNLFIRSIDQKEYRSLLLVGFILFSIIPLITNQVTISNDGYTIIHFIYMYLIGAYLKKYPIEKNYHFQYYSRCKRQVIFLGISIFCLFFNFILLQFSHSLVGSNNSLLNEMGNYLFNNNRLYSNPVVIIQSIFYFLYFSTLKIKKFKLRSISKVILDVYLIHENYYMISYLYFLLKTRTWYQYGAELIILMVIVGSILIFICSLLLGYVRYFISMFIGKRKFVIKIKEKFYCYLENF